MLALALHTLDGAPTCPCPVLFPPLKLLRTSVFVVDKVRLALVDLAPIEEHAKIIGGEDVVLSISKETSRLVFILPVLLVLLLAAMFILVVFLV